MAVALGLTDDGIDAVLASGDGQGGLSLIGLDCPHDGVDLFDRRRVGCGAEVLAFRTSEAEVRFGDGHDAVSLPSVPHGRAGLDLVYAQALCCQQLYTIAMERPFRQFEPRETPPAPDAEVAEVSHRCYDVQEAFERALHGDGVGVVYPLGIDLATRQHMHEQVIDEISKETVQQNIADKVQHIYGFDPAIFEPLYSKCLVDNESLSKPMIAANLDYMLYPPESFLAAHYDFPNQTMIAPYLLPEESLTIVYVVSGTKRLWVQLEGKYVKGEPTKRELTQYADMLIVIRGGSLMDGDQVRQAIWHWVPELRDDEIAASVTFDLMPMANKVEEE